MSLDILLISVDILKERTNIHGNVDEKLIYPDIKYAQDNYILPLLGTALFSKLQTLISASTITDAGNSNYKLLMDRYIVDAMIYYTLAELQVSASYQLWNKGVQRKGGVDTETPSMSELVDMHNRYKNRAETYANRLKDYLRAHASATNCPEYLNPGSTADTITPEQRAFTLPIFLDDDKCNPYCNPGGFNGQPYSE
jgi:hypothetical protein